MLNLMFDPDQWLWGCKWMDFKYIGADLTSAVRFMPNRLMIECGDGKRKGWLWSSR